MTMTEKIQHPWWEKCIAYQIYPRSFQDSNGDGIGDLKGIIQRLPYLKELGIDLIWICPINTSPNDDNGYDISDYLNIQEEYGTMDIFDELLAKAHANGIRVIMDLVINHTSSAHQWFIESRSAKSNPKRDWYIWRDGKDGKEPNNWESIFGGSAWEYDEQTEQYYLHLFGKTMPDLNWESTAAKQAIYQMINQWLEKGIDGFRVDAISHIKKPDYEDMPNPKKLQYVNSFDKHMNQEGILDLLEELKENTFSHYDIFTIAEASGVQSNEMEEWVSNRKGKFSSIFQFEHQDLWNMEGAERFSLQKVKNALSKWQNVTRDDGNVALVLENHDLTRCINRFGSPDKYWKESAKCLALMYFMQKGVPFIYQGQEIGMINADYTSAYDYRDLPALYSYEQRIQKGVSEEEAFRIIKETVRDNSRTPMQWEDTAQAGFTTGLPWIKVNQNFTWLNVEQQRMDPNSIWNFYRKMISLRKEHDALMFGKYKLLMPKDDNIYAYTRSNAKGYYMIACNVSEETRVLDIPINLENGLLLLGNYENPVTTELEMSPYECRLYQFQN